MKILLLGEYSNVHHSLATGLRALGHSVTVVSDGDGWKDYPRDVDISRQSTGVWHTIRYLFRLHRLWPRLRGYDVVQLINPVFLELKAERILPYYKSLRRRNKNLFMGAYGMDYYWAKAGCDCTTFRYSDFNLGGELRNTPDTECFKAEWLRGGKGELNRYIAEDCDGIVCGLYEYYASYTAHFAHPEKLAYIPFPIIIEPHTPDGRTPQPVRFFIGIQRSRNAYKGTDIMLAALERLHARYPESTEIVKAENVPFEQYKRMMLGCDVILDQLYSYTPAMNALQAMSQGLVLVGGGEPEHYDLMNESRLRPIINVEPSEESVYSQLEQLVLHPERIPQLKRDSVEYIQKHHDHVAVAQSYLRFWKQQ
ncbi:MAG: glycosyltransferase family 1 protein [Bacteroidaceae bacterium]|nr:glycosyltransferase family 1 protein [Bacteroidaceae bacterium]